MSTDDYVAPAAACVNPLFASPRSPPPTTTPPDPPEPLSDEQPATKKLRGAAKISVDSGIFSNLGSSTSLASNDIPFLTTGSSSLDSVMQKEPKKKHSLIKQNERRTARVTLNDCLACSGCVTSAETVLIESQSVDKFQELLSQAKDKNKEHSNIRIVVSLSPQSVAALAAHFDLPTTMDMYSVLSMYFKSLGVSLVCSTQGGNDVALLETTTEFIERFRNKRTAVWSRPRDSVADSSVASHCPKTGEHIPLPRLVFVASKSTPTTRAKTACVDSTNSTNSMTDVSSIDEMYNQLPMLASNCPGWICYAEKTHPQSIPYISTCRSPQQILGRVLKGSWLPLIQNQNQKEEENVNLQLVHVTVMPCPDKKLEASRRDFFEPTSDGSNNLEPDVNLVLTTSEVLDMIKQDGFDVLQAAMDCTTTERAETNETQKKQNTATSASKLSIANFESIFTAQRQSTFGTVTLDSPTAVANVGGAALGSGGYLDYIFRRAARELFGVMVTGPLEFTATKNPDFQYTELIVDGRTVLKFARAYGFRSIQTVVRQLKRKKCRYHYIEVMACPSGCLNGGGQPRGKNSAQTKEILAVTYSKFHEGVGTSTTRSTTSSTTGTTTSSTTGTTTGSTTPAVTGSNLYDPLDSVASRHVYNDWLSGEGGRDGAAGFHSFSSSAVKELHTQYHAVAKMEEIAPMFATW